MSSGGVDDDKATGAAPLSANASTEEILARIRHLGASVPDGAPSEATPSGTQADAGPIERGDAPRPGDAPASAPGGGPAPLSPPTDAAPAPSDATGASPTTQWQTPRRTSRRRLGGLAAIAVVVAGVGAKLALGLVTATVVGATLGALFGGQFERLPGDQRAQLESRFDAAVGDRLKGLSDQAASDRVAALVGGGLPRLDDPTLLEYEATWTAAVAAVDTPTCATVVRTKGPVVPVSTTEKVLSSLDTTRLGRWYEITVQAIEAESRGAPAARSVATADADRMYAALGGKLTSQDATSLQALSNGTAVSDQAACDAYRHLYAAGLALDPADRAVFVLEDVTP
ncbi:MAG TPA: hypothetical protein VEY67_00205 [Candidatus Dormibacteraeota bacterium]|nr:hypothetical protein [Candidatus Dormibacteraeota bacterium]